MNDERLKILLSFFLKLILTFYIILSIELGHLVVDKEDFGFDKVFKILIY